MQSSFNRTRSTLLLYFILALYGYVMNAFGPVTPFLKAELNLSYTVSSLHFSAFAVGMILTGLGGHLVIARLGRWRSLWVGGFGMCLAELLLMAGRSPVITIGAAFIIGTIGSLIPAAVTTALSDQHGEQRSIALMEANVIASTVITAAPLMIGWLSHTALGWRTVLFLPGLVMLGLRFGFGRVAISEAPQAVVGQSKPKGLPRLFWVYWLAIFFAEAVEFCMISWCADYLEKAAGLPRADAVGSVSFFMAGMILGRMAISRLLLRFTPLQLVMASVLITGVGFGVFWSPLAAWMSIAGLFLCGLGISGLYPLILALAIGAARGNADLAGARASLGAGLALLVLPLSLGRVADLAGIRSAYGLVIALLAILFVILRVAARQQAERRPLPG